jgi:mevalonate kinase
MPSRTSFAPGKIILSGEYAVVFGQPGIAVPTTRGFTAIFTENLQALELTIEWPDAHPLWKQYIDKIVTRCLEIEDHFFGTLKLSCNIPLGKGMGSSTAAVIAVCRALLGEDCETIARTIEDELNPGHSGIDFAAIWRGAPVEFQKDMEPKTVRLEYDLLTSGILIDTGEPTEPTPELVSWIRDKQESIDTAIRTIGHCTERLIAGEDPTLVIRDHHQAQVALGVVPTNVQTMVEAIEKAGGAAKVIGAGGRAGGAGMVLAFGENIEAILAAIPPSFDTIDL